MREFGGGQSYPQSGLTDIASGWTEAAALIVREQTLITVTLDEIQSRLPFAMLGLDVDNDSAFINETLLGYCRKRELELTRSRAYKKNDQAWIEQKNGAVIRKLVGYGRLEGADSTVVLAELHKVARLYVNFFQPSFKLKSKNSRRQQGDQEISRSGHSLRAVADRGSSGNPCQGPASKAVCSTGPGAVPKPDPASTRGHVSHRENLLKNRITRVCNWTNSFGVWQSSGSTARFVHRTRSGVPMQSLTSGARVRILLKRSGLCSSSG